MGKSVLTIPKALTLKQIEFVKHYVATACKDIRESMSKAGYADTDFDTKQFDKIVKSPIMIAAIKKEQERIAYLLPMLPSFQAKADLLWKMVYDCKDDDRERGVALKAIAELNKMQGHYSAEKHIIVNLNADADVEITKALVKQYKQEY